MKKVAILLFITSSFVFAQNTYVPDDKFEQALIDLGYDTTLDDYVLTANISGVTTLNVSNKEISDLTKETEPKSMCKYPYPLFNPEAFYFSKTIFRVLTKSLVWIW